MNIDNLRNRYAQLCAITEFPAGAAVGRRPDRCRTTCDPARDGAVDDTQAALGIDLPADLKAISQFFAGDLCGCKEHYRLEVVGPSTNVTEETLRLRGANGLPQQFVVLAEPPESLILLDIKQGNVIWLDAFDVHNLVDGRPMTGSPMIWRSYAEFFEYLLDNETAKRKRMGGAG